MKYSLLLTGLFLEKAFGSTPLQYYKVTDADAREASGKPSGVTWDDYRLACKARNEQDDLVSIHEEHDQDEACRVCGSGVCFIGAYQYRYDVEGPLAYRNVDGTHFENGWVPYNRDAWASQGEDVLAIVSGDCKIHDWGLKTHVREGPSWGGAVCYGYNGPSPPPEATGDPHIKTWVGEKYDFHGVCDLVMLSNPGFDNGHGMDIHIRNKRTRVWSYISTAAVRIGEDILQIMGGTDSNKYFLNGDARDAESKNSDGVLDDFGGYKLKYQRISDVSVEYEVVLKNGDSIALKTWNAMVSVKLNKPLKEDFGGSLGLLGSYPTGAKVARDNKTIISDSNEFGQEWQVIDTEPKLFIESEGPQFPAKCQIPAAVDMRRRLASSSATIEMAKTACLSVREDDKDLCIFDVLATNNIDAAGAY
jgi:hypothetical protein